MCEALHHKVINLERIRIMNINLGNIKDGQFREIKGTELKTLLTSFNLEKNTN
jgi:23S rRNA pseudouridine2604 synthase